MRGLRPAGKRDSNLVRRTKDAQTMIIALDLEINAFVEMLRVQGR
jgi:hypothetical protein